MPANDNVQNLIDRLVSCDEQPSEEDMAELRGRLKQKVRHMQRRGRHSLYVCLGAAVLMLCGVLIIGIAAGARQEIIWLTRLGFGTAVAGAILEIAGCIGLLLFRGFGFVWARHDFQEAAITELSLQVERLSEQIDKLSKSS